MSRSLPGRTTWSAVAIAIVASSLVATPCRADDGDSGKVRPLPTIEEHIRGLERMPGLLDLVVDRERGRVLAVVPPPAERGVAGSYLYIEGLVAGLGSNPVGLDRSQLGPTRVVELRRVGGRVLVEAVNTGYRALDGSAAEQRAVRESFATSVLWAGEVVALDPDGSSLVDLTSFVVRDAHGVVRTLAETGQGDFSLDAGRSAVDLHAVLAFPDNLELEATLTYAGDDPGTEVRAVTPAPTSVTVVQHHSLIRLPNDGYRPRPYDPREGSFDIAFADYAAPLGAPLEVRWIARHRLEKVDPGAPSSPAVEPIVYYLDRGVPEPVRSALLDGAGWWEKTFAAAGFEDAFRVEMLPEGAHPLDVRYNVIQWVHRATRGWSYGGAVIDPRTGEILKGHVLLGSLRVRQDIRIFQGLLGAGEVGSGGPRDPVQLALARLRQLAAHEVGHTLGLAHNFAASAQDRASVMDYPAPLVRLADDGSLDVSDAYGAGVGPWDLHAIRYAYAQVPPGDDESAMLADIVRQGLADGLVFLSDGDARPPGAANPMASLWDNGSDPVEELRRVMAVRGAALARFGVESLAPGRPLAELEEVLAPLYLFHRYQLTAAAKVLGGVGYRHAVRGDGQPTSWPVSAERQRAALATLLDALEPAVLDLPDRVLDLMLPPTPGSSPSREDFGSHTDPAFDAVGAAATAASLVVREVLQPERLARMVDLHRRGPAMPDASEAMTALVGRAFAGPVGEATRLAQLRRAVQWVVADALVGIAEDSAAAPSVRGRAEASLREVASRTAHPGQGSGVDHRAALHAAVVRFLEKREWSPTQIPEPLAPPPGDPIGAGCACAAWHDRGD